MHVHGLDPAAWHWCSHQVVALLVGLMQIAGGAARTELCERSQANCVHRVGCSAALQNYFFNCGEIIHGEARECVPRCRKALIALMTTEDSQGERLMTCDCDNNTSCLDQRQKLKVCTEEVFIALDNLNNDDVDISCSLAQQICEADTSCNAALGYYIERCTKLFMGDKCTESCNNSLSILYRQQKARKLRTCICDGTMAEKHACTRVRQNIGNLCLTQQHRVRHGHGHDHTRAPTTDTEEKPTYILKNVSHSSASWNEELNVVRTGGVSSSCSTTWILGLVTLTLALMPQR